MVHRPRMPMSPRHFIQLQELKYAREHSGGALKECAHCKNANIGQYSTHCQKCAAKERERRGSFWYGFVLGSFVSVFSTLGLCPRRAAIIDHLEPLWPADGTCSPFHATYSLPDAPAMPERPLQRNQFGHSICEIKGCNGVVTLYTRRCAPHLALLESENIQPRAETPVRVNTNCSVCKQPFYFLVPDKLLQAATGINGITPHVCPDCCPCPACLSTRPKPVIAEQPRRNISLED